MILLLRDEMLGVHGTHIAHTKTLQSLNLMHLSYGRHGMGFNP